MNAVPETRTPGTFREIAGVVPCLLLVFAGATLAAQTGRNSAMDQLQAAEAAVNQMQQNPPVAPVDWRHAKDIDDASQKFADWQRSMFQQRDEIAKKQAKLLHDRMKVPPPLPPSAPDNEPPMTRLDLPLPFWPANVNLNLSIGEPTISFGIGAEGKALSCVGASYKVETAYVARENRWVVDDPVDIKAAFGSEKVQAAGVYQLLASVWTKPHEEEAGKKKQVGGEIGVELLQVKGAIGYNNQHELSLTAGYDLIKTPQAFSKVFEASVGVEAQVAAPVVVHGLTQGGKHNLPAVLAEYSAKVAKLLTEPRPCPYCSAKGNLDCPTCHNARSIDCPECKGKKSYTCHECGGREKVTCPRCKGSSQESCGSCSGKGRLSCPTCHGRGTMRYYRSETRTRQRTVVDNLGFDSSGQAVYQRHTEPEEYTESVGYWDDCGTCGGNGLDGTCGRCNGSGKVPCRKCHGTREVECKACKGTGSIDCNKCRRTGKITCPTCGGKMIECPLCQGKVSFGH
jgi:hypothetical protein